MHEAALQLLAYHTALARGTDVVKPRILAMSRHRKACGKLYCSVTPALRILAARIIEGKAAPLSLFLA
ncbi:hypothetical protein AB595_16940 [Massilia sp. WF1]|uniref:hypothetical protein n=1 Tax=Massilia sp. WF1 TaxID=1406431 RepID=UPI00064B6585|nr:hypothetical protein [Massilia sp. WF1]KLU35657.1 hypothetical protein AB595_16940 [Massilia sp. WF1]